MRTRHLLVREKTECVWVACGACDRSSLVGLSSSCSLPPFVLFSVNNSLWFGVVPPTVYGTPLVFTLTFAVDPANLPANYRTKIAADIATALNVAPARVTVTSITAVASNTTSQAHASHSISKAAASQQAQVEFTIAPSTSSTDVTPAAALNDLKSQLADPTSNIFKGTYTNTVVPASLVVVENGSGGGTPQINHANRQGASTFIGILAAAVTCILACIQI
jgi:hypothetical protein